MFRLEISGEHKITGRSSENTSYFLLFRGETNSIPRKGIARGFRHDSTIWGAPDKLDYVTGWRRNPPVINITRNVMMKITNKILAIVADAPAIAPKPKNAATIANIRNNRAQYSITKSSFVEYFRFLRAEADSFVAQQHCERLWHDSSLY